MILSHRYTNNLGEDAAKGVKKTRKYLDQFGGVDGKSCKGALDSKRYKESDGNECREHFICYSYKKERRGRWERVNAATRSGVARVKGITLFLSHTKIFSVQIHQNKGTWPSKYLSVGPLCGATSILL